MLVQSVSIVELGNLVIEWPFHAFRIICVILSELGQCLDPLTVLVQGWVLREKLTFTDPVHELTKLEHCEVDVGDRFTSQESILSQEAHDSLHLLE